MLIQWTHVAAWKCNANLKQVMVRVRGAVGSMFM